MSLELYTISMARPPSTYEGRTCTERRQLRLAGFFRFINRFYAGITGASVPQKLFSPYHVVEVGCMWKQG